MTPLPYQDPPLPVQNPTAEDLIDFQQPVAEMGYAMQSTPPAIPPQQSQGLSFDFNGLIQQLETNGFDSLSRGQQELLYFLKENPQVQMSPEQMANYVIDQEEQFRAASTPEAQADLTIAQDTIAKNEAERIQAEREKAATLNRADQEYQRMTGLIDKLKNHPGRLWATGGTSMLPKARGSDAYDFKILLDQLRGKQFLAGFQSIKGGGQITELEGAKAEAAVARTEPGQSEEQFLAGLDDFKAFLTDEYKNTYMGYGATPPGFAEGSTDQPAPADPFQIGKRYRDAAGNIRTYKGNGTWE